jgi:hypothetical protein
MAQATRVRLQPRPISCSSRAGCGAGLCKNFVGLGQFCTQTCDGGCPSNTSCFALGAEELCLKPDAGSAGVCSAAFVCNEPAPNPDTGTTDTVSVARTPPQQVAAATVHTASKSQSSSWCSRYRTAR